MDQTSKRIGFVDFDLENFHANVYLAAFRKELAARGYIVAGGHAMKETEGRAWAEKNEVPYFARLKALNKHVDCFAVLAPSNPEVHMELCRKVFPFGKPTFIDKTVAPNLRTAERIFALADKCKTPVLTTSALRYTNVQQYVKEAGGRDSVKHMVAWGGGRSFGEYAIHPTELVISSMGPTAESMMRRGNGDQSQLLLNFAGGRTAVINAYVSADTPFAASVTTDTTTRLITVDGSRLFVDMAAGMLDFFDAGTPSVDRQESLAIRRILDAAENPRALTHFVKL